MGKVINEPTRNGFEHGYHLSRFADIEEEKQPLANGNRRCRTCAFRCGTYPSGSPTTTMDALKCVIEKIPFMCHEERKPCSGWALMVRGTTEAGVAPWPFSDEISTEGTDALPL